MPRRPRFRTAALRDLFDGLRYAPEETLERQMESAEALALELEPFELYRRGDVVRRVTGFRTTDGDAGDEDAAPTLVGQAVLTDLSTFVERTSERARLRPTSRPGGAFTLDEAAARLGVSGRSLLRYRSLGLVVHWIDFGGVRRVGCFARTLERFREKRLGLAPRGRSRRAPVDGTTEAALVDRAKALLRDGPASLRGAVTKVSAALEIDPRAVRRVLARSGLPFARRVRRSRADLRLAYRAWRRGVDAARLAERLERDHAACWRAVNAGRRGALRALRLPMPEALPTFAHPEAAEVLLAPGAVASGLFAGAIPADASDFLGMFAPTALPPRAGEVDACRRLVAMRYLLWRATRAIARLRASPTGAELDRIETDLRNAWLLRRTLVAHALPSALGRIEGAIGGRLVHLPTPILVRFVRRGLVVTAESLDHAEAADAAEGRLRVARHVALQMDRALALDPPSGVDRRAAAVHRAGAPMLADADRVTTSWWELLPRPFAPTGLERLDAAGRALLERRHGWDGGLALSIAELARRERVAPSMLQHRMSEAWARLR